MSHTAITQLFSSVCPWLVLVRVFQLLAGGCGLNPRGWGRLSLLGLIALGVLAVPVQGIAIAGWVTGVNGNFSIPFTGLLAAAVGKEPSPANYFPRETGRRAGRSAQSPA